MTLTPSNSHMFFAYHIRSVFLTSEVVLRKVLKDRGLSLDHFHVLRCDWKQVETSFDDIKAHAMLTRQEAHQSISDLISQDLIVRGEKQNHYLLSPEGVTKRKQVLELYSAHLSEFTEGLSQKEIESALSSLLKIQNNIHQHVSGNIDKVSV